MRAEKYQWALVLLVLATIGLGGYFFYLEVAPQYKIFQKTYVKMEEFRSSITGEPPPAFQFGVKQIVLFPENKKGPETIDRCMSCHVALDIPQFSPTKLQYDVNGNLVVDAIGNPVKIPNEDYVWKKLDEKIASLLDPQKNKELEKQGQESIVQERLAQAAQLTALKTTEIDGRTIDMSKVLAMHPLIGQETRPFEYHPVSTFGCASCHGGNGRALTIDNAHGPLFDGEYEPEYEGPTPQFSETDLQNDPPFARMFNHKPGPDLIFQTTPILVGGLIEAKCVQCHQSTEGAYRSLTTRVDSLTSQREAQIDAIKKGMQDDEQALLSLLELRKSILSQGFQATVDHLSRLSVNFTLSPDEIKEASAQALYLTAIAQKNMNEKESADAAVNKIDQDIIHLVGSVEIGEQIEKLHSKEGSANGEDADLLLKFYVEQHEKLTGTLFAKAAELKVQEAIISHMQTVEQSFDQSVKNEQAINKIVSDIDLLTKTYHRGEELFISEACYACHRVAGFSRGGVGPELSTEGFNYPWKIKQKLVWPQGDLRTSTMPNMLLDHVELEALMTYLLGQVGKKKYESEVQYKRDVSEWESGRKLWWENPLNPDQITDVRNSMIIFATQGCASCHKLKGFDSNVGFAVEAKDQKPDFDTLYREREWFQTLFPEQIIGSQIVDAIGQHSADIDRRIVSNVRTNGLLEEIEAKYPDLIEGYYSPFKYAFRAKNAEFEKMAADEKDPAKKAAILHELVLWKEKVHRVLMMYIQEYGLGRLIGPRLNWSGVYRSDQWIMDHFHNPTSEVPKSLMPAFPFDDSKFYALTYMLDVLGQRNRAEVQELWTHRGFDPAQAFHIHCAICHGEGRLGNGPVSEWIYPIPKNLTSGTFLREMTKPYVIQSITHGVKGTPMPPWGEASQEKPQQIPHDKPVLTTQQIQLLADWLFSTVTGSTIFEDNKEVPKWQYTPQDVLEEIHHEGGQLKGEPENHQAPVEQKGSESSDNLKKKQTTGINLGQKTRLKQAHAIMAQVSLVERILGAFKYTQSASSDKQLNVDEVFDIGPPLVPGPEAHSYFIKKKYYTVENLIAGERFFDSNCAICHGKEGDGTGLRAESMYQAKPRMLINLRWLNTRDDLYMLRSIKYGVPGTAMTPWGDLTTSLQRMQLVMYIRSLSTQELRLQQLSDTLYQAFSNSEMIIEEARSQGYAVLDKLAKEIDQLKTEREKYGSESKEGEDKAIAAYRKEIDLRRKYEDVQKRDQMLIKLRQEVEKNSGFCEAAGKNLITQKVSDEDFAAFLSLIKLNGQRYSIKDGKLEMNTQPEFDAQFEQIESQILNHLSSQIQEWIEQKNQFSKQTDQQAQEKLTDIETNIKNYTKLKDSLITALAEAKRSRERQMKMYQELDKIEWEKK